MDKVAIGVMDKRHFLLKVIFNMGWDEYFDHTGLLVNMSVPGGDGGDSAQMMGLYRMGKYLSVPKDQLPKEQAKFEQELNILTYIEYKTDKQGTVLSSLSHNGVYLRHPAPATPSWAANPHCTSRDQQESLSIAMGALKQRKALLLLLWKHICRFGFYQNNQQIDGSKQWADFAGPDILGGYIRALFLSGIYPIGILWPVLFFTDVYCLIAFAINFISWNNPNTWWNSNNSDDDNLIMNIMLNKKSLPTPFSWLLRKLYKHLRPMAGGLTGMSGPESAMTWKHRASTGSPPMASLWCPILEKEL